MSIAFFLGGCSVSMEMTSHTPAHPIGGNVDFSATATGDVDRIDLWIAEYEILPDMTQGQLINEPSIIKSCNPPAWTNSLTCKATHRVSGQPRLIKFEARAHAPGAAQKSEAYMFASGKLDTLIADLEQDALLNPTGDPGGVNYPVPIRVNSFDTLQYLDIVMIPDTDLAPPGEPDPLEAFRGELDEVIALYFKYKSIRKARGLFNFFYSQSTGEYLEPKPGGTCEWEGPESPHEIFKRADVALYLHKVEKLDCTSGGKVSSEINNEKSLVHESGHGLYNLSDEYEIRDGSYYRQNGQQACMRNVWISNLPEGISGRTNCRADVPDGLTSSDCVDIVPPGNVWRVDPADREMQVGCIMGELQHSEFSDFGPACLRRINWVYRNCFASYCMAECPEESN